MKRQLHWYARDVEAYGRDTAHLSLAEHGAYNLLLDHYYSTQGSIPSGIDLRRVCRAMTEEEGSVVDRIVDQFFPIDPSDGRRHNKRADAEIRKISGVRELRSKAGKIANEVRWGTDTNRIPLGIQDGSTATATVKPNTTTADAVSPPAVPADTVPACPFSDLVAMYHQILPTNPKAIALNDKRRGLMRARWRELWERRKRDNGARSADDLLNWFAGFFGHVGESEFLTGRSKPSGDRPPFVADIEWIFRPENFLKIAEGKYHGGQA